MFIIQLRIVGFESQDPAKNFTRKPLVDTVICPGTKPWSTANKIPMCSLQQGSKMEHPWSLFATRVKSGFTKNVWACLLTTTIRIGKSFLFCGSNCCCVLLVGDDVAAGLLKLMSFFFFFFFFFFFLFQSFLLFL
jgi:hypothetical protein